MKFVGVILLLILIKLPSEKIGGECKLQFMTVRVGLFGLKINVNIRVRHIIKNQNVLM